MPVSPETLLWMLESLANRQAIPVQERLRQDAEAFRMVDAKVQMILSQRRKDATHNR